MKAHQHWLTGAERMPTRHVGDYIDPTLFLVHGTASRITKYNCAKYCQKNSRKVSYHFIIELDGTVVQLAPIDRRVNHAGRSKWKGRKWCNGFSVSVGLVNPGPLGPLKRSWFKKTFEGAVKMASPYHPNKYWLPFTDAQKEALHQVYAEVNQMLGKELDVAGHFQVSPGRKSDPNPTLDLITIGAPSLEEVPAVAPEPKSKNVLAKVSREYQAENVLKVAAGGTGAGAVALRAADAFSLSNINGVKAYFDAVNGFISGYGFEMFLVGCFGAYVLLEAIQFWKRQSYEDGRYEPSGEQEQENAAGGQWT